MSQVLPCILTLSMTNKIQNTLLLQALEQCQGITAVVLYFYELPIIVTSFKFTITEICQEDQHLKSVKEECHWHSVESPPRNGVFICVVLPHSHAGCRLYQVQYQNIVKGVQL